MIYIMCFLLSAFFIWIGTGKCTLTRMKIGIWEYVSLIKISTLVGVLILVILASLRDTSVGSDVEYYVVPYFKEAVNSSKFFNYLSFF